MRRFLCALLLLPALCAAAAAQYTTVTASKIQSNVSGALLPTGYFALTPVNAAGQPTGLTVFGGGQVLPNTYYWPISQGAISGVSVPDVSIATPTGIGYRVSITDANRIPLYTYTQAIYPSGGTWSFDTWSPSSTAQATPAGALIYGSQAPTGRCTAPSLYYYGSGTVTQLNCVGGTWTPMASGGSMVYPGAGIPVSTGSAWLSSLAAPSGALVGTTDTQALTNKTLDGVTPATMAYLDATSSIQTQLNARQGTLALTTTGSSGPATLNGSTLNIPTYSFSMVYPAAGVAVSNGSAWLSSLAAPAGALVGATDTQSLTNKTLDGVTPATMAYLDATSSIQTQLNARQGTLTLTTTGSSGPATLSGSTLNIPSYSSPIATVFGRTGNVAAASGDYTAAQVTNAADLSSGSTQSFTGNISAPVVNATTGFQVAGAAAAGNYLRGDGSHYVASAIQPGDLPASVPLIVASGTVPGATASVGTFTVYTPTAAGIYRICASYVVTSAGSTGATLEGYGSFYAAGVAHGPVFGSGAEAATSVGASGPGYGQNTCLTALTDANKAIGIGFIVGGSPATNPTFTYWYVVTQL